MKQLFLYRLFRHSKSAFGLIALFLIIYVICYYKKMDMILFPYNSMYAIDFNKTTHSRTYAMKINNEKVNITNNLYWKKDLLETSLNGYCRYLQNGRNVFLNEYLNYRFSNERLRNSLLNRLIPDKQAAMQWPNWFANEAGYTIPSNATIEFIEYNFMLEKTNAVLKDSISIYKTIQP